MELQSFEEQEESQAAYTPEQLESIVSKRVERAERAALKSLFQQQGLDEAEMESAITKYRETRDQKKPDVEAIRQQAAEARQAAVRTEAEKQIVLAAAGLGLDARSLPYVLRMADLSGAADEEGNIDKEYIKQTLNQLLEDFPLLKPAAEENKGFRRIGAGKEETKKADQDTLAGIFGNRKG